jgi:hypothetical protein
MRRRNAIAGSLALGIITFALSPLPALGAESGSVALSIQVATPCITVGPASLVFPSKTFSVSSASPSTATASPRHVVTNCGGSTELLFARGSNATNAGGSAATWTLVPPASIDTNKYALALDEWDVAKSASVGGPALSLQDKPLSSLDPSKPPREFDAVITLPTAGSDGAGQTMGMSITYTATF